MTVISKGLSARTAERRGVEPGLVRGCAVNHPETDYATVNHIVAVLSRHVAAKSISESILVLCLTGIYLFRLTAAIWFRNLTHCHNGLQTHLLLACYKLASGLNTLPGYPSQVLP